MTPSLLTRAFALSGLAFLVLQTGCVTRNLWEETYFAPAIPADIRLYESASPPGVIVEYNERIAGGRSTGRQAFLLTVDDRQSTNGVPVFLPSGAVAASSQPIPILPVRSPAVGQLEEGYWAIASPNPHQFHLYRDGRSLGTFELPFYSKRNRTVGRVMLTPVAVVADAAVSVFVFTSAASGAP
jgi:hypothetical protein